MKIRVLGLGNDLLADDRFGIAAATELERQLAGQVEVVYSATSGFDLMDLVVGATHLLVLDTLQTGQAEPGSVHEFHEDQVQASGLGPQTSGSPHYVGLFEALALGRELGLAVPRRVAIVAVEPADCLTVGGAMSETVASAVFPAVERARGIIAAWVDAEEV